MAYHAFISYSHAADGKLAPALQRALHRFAKPLFKLRALRVFRDKESLSANPALWPAIEKALSESEYFLLLASPGSARSPWVVREIEWWSANRPLDKQLIVLTDGELAWDGANRDFAWERTTALPKCVAGRFADEPLWVDLRWAKTAEELSLQHSQFRAAVLDLAAPLHGKPKEELDSEDVRQFRKTKRIRRAAIAALTALTVTAVAAAVFAVLQRNEAIHQRDVALSRQTASQALRVVDASIDTALLLAVEASRRSETFEARNALLSTLTRVPKLGFFLPGHRASVTTAAFTPDGTMLASGSSDDGAVIFWDLGRRQAVGPPIVAHERGVAKLVFSADGRLLASAGNDGTVRIWDASTRQPLGEPLRAHAESVAALAFSPDSRTLASADSNSIRLWNANTRMADGDAIVTSHRVITALAFDPGGTTLASGGGSGTVTLWNLQTPERSGRSFFDGTFFVTALTFSAEGEATAIGLSQQSLIRWNLTEERPKVHPLSTGANMRVTSLDTRATALNASASTLLVAIPGAEIMLLDLIRAENREPLVARTSLKDIRPSSGVLTVALSANGEQAVTGYRDGTLAVWNIAEHHILARALQGNHKQDVTALAFAPRAGMPLVTGSDDGTLMLWDASSLRPLGPPLTGHKQGITSAAFNPSGEQLASGDRNGTVLLWDVARRTVSAELSGLSSSIGHLVFSPNAGTLAVAQGKLLLWDVATRQSFTPVLDAPTGVVSVAFSPDGKTLVVGGIDSTVRMWDVASRRMLGQPAAAHATKSVDHVAFHPHRNIIASVADIRLGLWTVNDDRTLGSLTVLDPIDRDRRQAAGGGVAFTPDGRLLVSGGNGRIALWDVVSGQALESVLRSSRGSQTRLATSPDGNIVAASDGEEILLWDIGLSSWQRHACRVANRDLTQEEWNTFVGVELPYRPTCSSLALSR